MNQTKTQTTTSNQRLTREPEVKLIRQMLQMQVSINQKIHTNWREKQFPWYRAIWTECAELMDHQGWKWWKKNHPDMNQIHLEIVDIWHFGLSDCMQYSEDENAIAHALQKACLPTGTTKKESFSATEILENIESLALSCLQLKRFPLTEFTTLMQCTQLDLTKLFRLYMGKNVLNRFRQDFGYQSGEYEKVWDGKEDNQHLAEILPTIDPSEKNFMDKVYNTLKQRYEAMEFA